jgi:hypothetical protein
MEKRHAYQLMQGAPIAREVCATAHISNKATLELAKVAPEKRQEVFEKATASASGHVPTRKKIPEIYSRPDRVFQKPSELVFISI